MLTTRSNRNLLGGLHYTTEHNGKMMGIESLSTSCRDCRLCELRRTIEGSVCEKCYSFLMHKMYKELSVCLAENSVLLTQRTLKDSEIPNIFVRYFRFEAFGELQNTKQVKNYFKICRMNPDVRFAIWTKNAFFIQEALECDKRLRKPKNLVIIQSSLMLNQQEEPKFECVDKVFTVYTKEYIRDHGTFINCEKHCALCGLCYKKNRTLHIHEVLHR